jgi:hypothetical protein
MSTYLLTIALGLIVVMVVEQMKQSQKACAERHDRLDGVTNGVGHIITGVIYCNNQPLSMVAKDGVVGSRSRQFVKPVYF